MNVGKATRKDTEMEIEKYGRTDLNGPGLSTVKLFWGDVDEHSASIKAVNIFMYKGLT
jgi:hypothetical protein